MKFDLKHLIPEKNIICAMLTAIIAISVAHIFEQSGGSISPDGSTCLVAARGEGGIYLSTNQVIYLVSALSILTAYIWDCVAKHLTAKKAKG